MNYKLVCWDGMVIPLPNRYEWLTMDDDGAFTAHQVRPKCLKENGFWIASGSEFTLTDGECDVRPPEPGPWDEQLYWIGD